MLVYCPECETACSEKASTCVKCGHPLGTIVALREQLPAPQAVHLLQPVFAPSSPTILIEPPKQSSLGVTSLVLGIVALVVCWIPFVGLVAILIGGLGCVLGGIGFIVGLCRGGAGIGYSIGGGLLSGLALLAASSQLAILGVGAAAIEEAAAVHATRRTESPPAAGP